MFETGIAKKEINCTESENSSHEFSLDYSLADTQTVVCGALAFCLVLPLVLFTFPCFPIGTTAAVLLGAFLMVATGVLSQTEVYEILGEAPNMRTILLLVSMMMLAQFFERENTLGRLLGKLLTSDQSFITYIFRVTLVTFLIAAIFTNDAACAIVTPLILEVWRRQNRPKIELETLLLAIATSANLGSVITIFGNPQNALIASATESTEYKKSQLNLLRCVKYLWAPAAIGYGFNMAFLVFHFRFLSRGFEAAHLDLPPEEPDKKVLERANSYEDKISGRGSMELKPINTLNSSDVELERLDNSGHGSFRFQIFLVMLLVAVVVLLFIQTRSIAFDIALVPLAANILIMVVDAAFRKRRPADVFKRVDWGIIMMFFGFFVWLGGVNKTRIARWVWQHMGLSSRSATDVESIVVLCCFVIFGSNLFSNVPLTIIVLEQLEPCKDQLPTVLYLAWGSTIAGNLTLFGSVANLIVAQQALVTVNFDLTFYKYIKFGFLSTLWIVTLGIVIIYGLLLLY